ncbi:MAG: cysteine desulfurase NifS [Desulfovibrionaceae bacterium]|nr:cysteine desulfurase NifS [Desulfovibrionaceae bacterium]
MKNKVIYLDNNATTQVDSQVVEAMLPFFTEKYGNASSMHSFGGNIGKDIRNARSQVASLLGARPDEIYFVSCGTEGDNSAIFSSVLTQPEKRHVITSAVEHSAVVATMNELKRRGYDVTVLGVDERGQISLDELRNAIREDTALISMMWANNETGTIFPIEEISAIAEEHGIQFHTDAVQAVGKMPINLKELKGIDYLVCSGHKLHAPKGIGVLYVRKGVRYKPYIIGGHQEYGKRAGTENTPYIIAMGVAAQLAQENLEKEQTEVAALRDMLEKELIARIPDSRINGDTVHRLPNTTNISFKNVEGEAILLLLDGHGICASSGSACTSGSLESSHVLRAMGVPFEYAHGSIRFSLSRYTTKEDIEKVIEVMPGIISRLREISPFKK